MISCLMINEKETNIIWSLKRGASIVANTLPPLGYWEVSAILHLARALRKRRPDVLSFKEEFRVIRFNVDSLDWKKMSESKRRGKVPRDAEGERLACARANFSVGIPTWDYRHLLYHPLQSPFILSKGGYWAVFRNKHFWGHFCLLQISTDKASRFYIPDYTLSVSSVVQRYE
mgnify:CR=1 FL=1